MKFKVSKDSIILFCLSIHFHLLHSELIEFRKTKKSKNLPIFDYYIGIFKKKKHWNTICGLFIWWATGNPHFLVAKRLIGSCQIEVNDAPPTGARWVGTWDDWHFWHSPLWLKHKAVPGFVLKQVINSTSDWKSTSVYSPFICFWSVILLNKKQ